MRKHLALAAGTALALGVAVLGAPSASAARDDCRIDSFCLWEHGDFSGLRFDLATEDSTFHNNVCAGCVSSKHPGSNGTWGDMISSYDNRTPRTYCVYVHTGYGGDYWRIAPYTSGNVDSRQNDEISSARPC